MLLAAGMWACAGARPSPPGGPEDREAPRLIRVSPDSGATSQHPREVEFVFDETVSDRPARGDLTQYFLISPSDGEPRVDWHRKRIGVRARRGFRENTAYTVTLLPGLADLRGNAMEAGVAVVFSTGATFPRFGIAGNIFDWAAERPAANALIQAIAHPDSVLYLATSDSMGAFSIGPFGPGRYTLRGIIDRNGNRALDPGEAWDSTSVLITTSRPIHTLLAIVRDSVPPRISAVAVVDSVSIRVTFDRPLDPRQELAPTFFRVQRADSGDVPIATVVGAAAAARAAAVRDSAAPRDSTRPSVTRGVPPSVVPVPTPGQRAQPVQPARPPAVSAPPPPKPPQPPPETAVILELAPPARLEAGATYRVTARDVPNLLGVRGTSSRTVAVPKPAPTPPAGARSDSTPPRRIPE